MIKLTKATNVATKQHKLVVVYGQGGIGKTYFASNNEMSKGSLIIQVEEDGGLSTISKMEDKIQTKTFAIKANQAGSPIGMVAKELIFAQQNDLNEIDTIIIDPLSNIRQNQANYISKTELGGGSLRIQDWGTIKNQIDNLFSLIIELKSKYNIVIVVHEDVISFDDSSSGHKYLKIVPAGGDYLVSKFEQFADEIVRITIKNDDRIYDFSGTYGTGKTRSFGHLKLSDRIKKNLKIEELLGGN